MEEGGKIIDFFFMFLSNSHTPLCERLCSLTPSLSGVCWCTSVWWSLMVEQEKNGKGSEEMERKKQVGVRGGKEEEEEEDEVTETSSHRHLYL